MSLTTYNPRNCTLCGKPRLISEGTEIKTYPTDTAAVLAAGESVPDDKVACDITDTEKELAVLEAAVQSRKNFVAFLKQLQEAKRAQG